MVCQRACGGFVMPERPERPCRPEELVGRIFVHYVTEGKVEPSPSWCFMTEHDALVCQGRAKRVDGDMERFEFYYDEFDPLALLVINTFEVVYEISPREDLVKNMHRAAVILRGGLGIKPAWLPSPLGVG